MLPLSIGISLLAAALSIHVVLWRVCLPKSQLKTLLLIFLALWLLAVSFWGIGHLWGASVLDLLYFSLFYWSAALCYVITYSAMEGDSPTLSLTRHLHAKGAEGVSHEEIEEFFRQRPFVGARVKTLVTDNILIEESGGYRLASGKYIFFRLILTYRRVVFGPIKSGG